MYVLTLTQFSEMRFRIWCVSCSQCQSSFVTFYNYVIKILVYRIRKRFLWLIVKRLYIKSRLQITHMYCPSLTCDILLANICAHTFTDHSHWLLSIRTVWMFKIQVNLSNFYHAFEKIYWDSRLRLPNISILNSHDAKCTRFQAVSRKYIYNSTNANLSKKYLDVPFVSSIDFVMRLRGKHVNDVDISVIVTDI